MCLSTYPLDTYHTNTPFFEINSVLFFCAAVSAGVKSHHFLGKCTYLDPPFHVLPVDREERRRGYSPFLVLCRRGEPSGEVMRRRGHTAVRERPVHSVYVPDGCLCGLRFFVMVGVFDYGLGGGGEEKRLRAIFCLLDRAE